MCGASAGHARRAYERKERVYAIQCVIDFFANNVQVSINLTTSFKWYLGHSSCCHKPAFKTNSLPRLHYTAFRTTYLPLITSLT